MRTAGVGLGLALLVAVIAVAPVAAEDWPEHRALAEAAPWLADHFGRDGEEAMRAAANDGVLVSPVLARPAAGALPVPAGDGVRLGDQRLELRPWDREAVAEGERGRRVVAWRFEVPADGAWMIELGDDRFTALTLDGSPLVEGHGKLWFAPGAGDPTHRLAAGPHVIMALYSVPERVDRHRPSDLDLIRVLDPAELALRLDAHVQSASGGERLQRMRGIFEHMGRAVDLAEATRLAYLERYFTALAASELAEPDAEWRAAFETLRDYVRAGPRGDDARRTRALAEILARNTWLELARVEADDHDDIREMAEDLLLAHRPDLAEAMVETAFAAVAAESDAQRELWWVKVSLSAQALDHDGHHHLARAWLPQAAAIFTEDERKRDRIFGLLKQLDFLTRSASGIVTDPVAAQAHHELGPLLERGAGDPRAVASILDLVLNGAGSLRDAGDRAVETALEATDRLRAHQDLRAAVRAEAQRRLERAAATAIARADLARIDELIARYAPVADVARLHLVALRQRMDRREDAAARRHAFALLAHPDAGVRDEAWASLVVLEEAMGLTPGERRQLPDPVAERKVVIGGVERSLAELGERHQLSAPPDGPPRVGASLAVHPRPPSLPGFAFGDRHQEDDLRFPRWWSRPVAAGEVVAYADPTTLVVCDRSDGSLRWQRSSPGLPRWEHHRIAHRFGLCATDGLLIHHTIADRGAPTLRAYDHAGRLIWDLLDDPTRDGWRPWTVPQSIGGSVWVVLTRQPPRAAVEVAIARLDLRAGELRDVQPLMQLGAEQRADSGLYDQRFAVGPEGAIFGSSGLGVVFRLDPLSGRLQWVHRLPAMPENRAPAASWIGVEDEAVVCYLPEVAHWVAFDRHDGSLLWRRYDGGVSHHHGVGTGLAVCSRQYGGGSVVECLDPRTGSLRWRRSLGGTSVTGEGAIHGERVLVPTTAGIVSLDLADGGDVRSIAATAEPVLSLAHHGDRISLLTESAWAICDTAGELAALAAPAWTLPPPRSDLPLPDLRHGVAVVADLENPVGEEFDERWHLLRVAPDSSRVLLYHSNRVVVLDLGGAQRAPRSLWQREYADTRIGPGLHAVGWFPRQLDHLGSEGVEWSYRPTAAGGRLNDREGLIVDAVYDEEFIAVRHEDGRVVLLRAADGAAVASAHLDGGLQTLRGSVVVESLQRPDRFRAVDLADGGRVLWEAERPDRAYWHGTGPWLVGNRGTKATVFDLRDGSRREFDTSQSRGHRWHDLAAGAVVGERLITAAGLVVDLASGETAQHTRATVARTGEAALLFDGEQGEEQVTLVHAGGAVELVGLPSRARKALWNMAEHYAAQISVLGDRAFVGGGVALYQVDLASGHVVAGYPHGIETGEDRQAVAVPGGFLFVSGYDIQVARATADAFDGRIPVVTRVADPGDDGWPRSGWAAPTRFLPAHWLAAEDRAPAAAYGVQVGYDEDFVYLRLVRGPHGIDDLVTRFEAAAVDNDDGPRLWIHWDASNRPQPATGTRFNAELRSWRRELPGGRADYRVAIPQADLGLDGSAPDRIDWRLVESDGEGPRGVWRIGGTLHVDERERQREDFQLVVDHPADRAARAMVYGQGSGFIPQGRELARWLLERRLADPRADNQALLGEMLARVAHHASAANVLACWYLERVRDLGEDPEAPDLADPAFLAECDRMAVELAEEARRRGVPEALITLGLARLQGVVLEMDIDDPWPRLMNEIRLRGDDRRDRLRLRTELDDPCVIGVPGRRLLVLPIGLFDGEAPATIDRLHFDDVRGVLTLMHWTFAAPGRESVALTAADGGLADGVRVDDNAVAQVQATGLGTGARVWVRRGRDFDLFFPAQRMPDVSAHEGLEPAAILRAIDALPSNSGSGDDLIRAYLDRVEEGEGLPLRELAIRALRRVGSNPWAAGEVTDLYARSLGGDVVSQLATLFEEADVERDVRRYLMIQRREDSERRHWRHLGPWPAALPVRPAPEQSETLAEGLFAVGPEGGGGEELRFTTIDDPMDLRGYDGEQRMYHHARLRLAEDDKVFLFVGQHQHRRDESTVTVWVDGREVASDERFPRWSTRVIAIPLRLEAGEHSVLIGETFSHQWGLRAMVGDADGAPIPGVNLHAP